MEILSIVFKNIWFPLHYVADIVNDSIQLGLCLIVVGGIENAWSNLFSFSLVVNNQTLHIVQPLKAY